MSRRTTELLLLLAATPPVLLIFALVDAQRAKAFTAGSLLVPAALLVAFVAAHLAVRRFASRADPGLLPITFLLSGIGLAVVTRLDAALAASQVMWLFVGVAALVATLIAVPSLEVLARYKYTLMVSSLVLLLAPAFIGREINGAKLWIRLGSVSFQPGELAKILIVLFLAAYLAENRELLSISTRRWLGLRVPEPRTMGPLLLMWALSLLVLVFERDLGSSLLFFAIFLAMLYTATGRVAYVAVGLVLFGGGATAAYHAFGHVRTRVDIWLHPFADAAGKGYQLVQSLFALAAGGLTGTGLGMGIPTRIPFVSTDFIFSAIGEELGLLGASAVVLCFLVFAIRGLATASRAKTDMAAFTAAGLVAAISLQAFVIVGGVTRLIPLTGVTLPFVSYGGSSLLSSFIALGLLLRAGDEGTGREAEVETTSTDLGVLGRIALGRRLTGVTTTIALLMAALVVNLTWIQVVDARALQNNPANTRNLAQQARDDRGAILTRDGVTLAESKRAGRVYERSYPKHDLAAHTVGYLSARYGRTGIESAENDVLAGGKRAFASWGDVIDAAVGRPVPGNDVVLTLDSRVQKAAEGALAGRNGACVVLDPRTGAVLAAAANPGYDPNSIDAQWAALNADASSPLLDRARNALYPPGSTFKVVTAAAALQNGTSPDTRIPAPTELVLPQTTPPLRNFAGESCGDGSTSTLAEALRISCNTAFAQLGLTLGQDKLREQAAAFGFGDGSLRVPDRVATSVIPAELNPPQLAQSAIGQFDVRVTPLEMAMIAGGIANGGTVMKPYLVREVQAPDLTRLSVAEPQTFRQAVPREIADQLTTMMVAVVDSGTGTAAQIRGVSVAGKTGTAQNVAGAAPHAWFISFAPANDPKVAVAVIVENGGEAGSEATGGKVAAPIARAVMQAVLGR